MKPSWYLLALTGLFLITQVFAVQAAKPVAITNTAIPAEQAAALIGPNKPWEWQLAKADYDERQRLAEIARVEAERIAAEQKKIAEEKDKVVSRTRLTQAAAGNFWAERIKTRCGEYGFDENDCNRIVNIAACESGFNPEASNGGRYIGLFQHAVQYWARRAEVYGVAGKPANDGEANIQVTLGMMKDSGFGAWECQG